MVRAVLDRIFAAVLVAVHGAPAAPTATVIHRPAPPALIYPTELAPGPAGLTAQSYLSVDLADGSVIFGRRPHEKRPIASLTKIMTGVLAAEQGDLNRRVRVPVAATKVEPNKDDLRAGRRYTRLLLLNSALMISANDSAYALGYDLGRGSMPRFYGLMNGAAADLGMRDTHYASPNGLDDVRNRSSANDQAIVAWYALGDPTFRKIVGTRVKRVPWAAPVHVKEYRNHNRMLFGYGGTYGVKTGFTTKAGACLVVAVRRGDRSVIGVLLGSKDIWTDMPRLIDASLKRASPMTG
jgi:serine-type D-Ala-D-Ala carboxypeptidase (penicillin-binding protein 5/6)